jgi:hypothetical protein
MNTEEDSERRGRRKEIRKENAKGKPKNLTSSGFSVLDIFPRPLRNPRALCVQN